MEISDLAIQSIEELTKIKKDIPTKKEYTTRLSNLIKNEFLTKPNYLSIFSNAYFSTYNPKISSMPKERHKKYIGEISWKLINSDKLNENAFDKLIEFCTNLSDHAQNYKEEINSLRGSCF